MGVFGPSMKALRNVARAGAEKLRRYGRRVARMAHPISGSDLQTALARLGPIPNDVVFVHSSLSRLGRISGGAPVVIEALEEWCGRGTVAMPTHTYCYPEQTGWARTFDPKSTASVVGAITDAFWRREGVLRSLHPTHSLAAKGPLAEALIARHELCDTPCGAGTPYERLVEWDAGVLMFGVTLNCYTLFHTAEDAAHVPYLYESKPYVLRALDRNGSELSIVTKRQDMSVPRRFADMAAWLEGRSLLRRVNLGRDELLWIPRAHAAHAALVQALTEDPWLLTERSYRGVRRQ
jgi:aminoglycoside 3-N-acetyltransferase